MHQILSKPSTRNRTQRRRTIAMITAQRQLASFAAAAIALAALCAQAVDYDWNDATGGNWTDNANWLPSTGHPNGTGDTADISLAGTYTVTVDAARTAGTVTLNSANATLDASNTLTVPDSGQFTAGTIAGTLKFNGGTTDVDITRATVAIPEPASLLLLGLAGVALAVRRRRKETCAALTVLLIAGICHVGSAIDYDWASAASGNWTTTTNWTPNGDPNGTGDTATIDADGGGTGYTATLDANRTIGSFTLAHADATLDTGANTLRVEGGTFAHTAGTINGTVRLHGVVTASGDIDSGQTVSISTGYNTGGGVVTSASGFTNNGTLSMTPQGVNSWGEYTKWTVTSGTLNNSGTWSMTTGGLWGASVYVDADILNNTGADLTFIRTTGGDFHLQKAAGSHENKSAWSVTNGTMKVTGGGTSFTQSTAGASLAVDIFDFADYSDTVSNTFSITQGSVEGSYTLRRTDATLGPAATVSAPTTFTFYGDNIGGADTSRPLPSFTGDVPANLTLVAKNMGTSEGGFLTTPGNIANGGEIQVISNGGAGFNGGEGRLIVGAGGTSTLTNNGAVTVAVDGMPPYSYGTLTARLNGHLVNNGALDLRVINNSVYNSGAETRLYGNLTNQATGTVSVYAVGTSTGIKEVSLEDGAAGTYINRGVFDLVAGTLNLNGGTLQNQAGGRIEGNGQITGSVSDGGTTAPGASIGELTMSADWAQSGTGILEIEIAGLGGVAGTDFDFLSVGGTATLGGTINVEPWNDFKPPFGSTYDVLTAGNPVSIAGLTLGGTYGAQFLYQVVDDTTLRLISQVPEPASALLFLLGLALLRRKPYGQRTRPRQI